jgi:hypothetical protein
MRIVTQEADFTPDQIVDMTFARPRAWDFTDEHRIYVITIADSVERLIHGESTSTEATEEAHWIFGKPDPPPVISFEECCTALRIDPDILRQGIHALQRAPVSRRATAITALRSLLHAGGEGSGRDKGE